MENQEIKLNTSVSGVTKVSPNCDSRCSICSSPLLEEIHQMYKAGVEYREIVLECEKRGTQHSIASLSRHFAKYKEYLNVLVATRMNSQLLADVDAIARHRTYGIALADKVYDLLNQGGFKPTVDDFVKLAKLVHKDLLPSNNEDDSDLIGIFKRAQEKFQNVSIFDVRAVSASDPVS